MPGQILMPAQKGITAGATLDSVTISGPLQGHSQSPSLVNYCLTKSGIYTEHTHFICVSFYVFYLIKKTDHFIILMRVLNFIIYQLI